MNHSVIHASSNEFELNDGPVESMVYKDNPHDNSSSQKVRKQKYSQLQIGGQDLENYCQKGFVKVDMLTFLRVINLVGFPKNW
jgi:hypothetical protein